MKNNNNTAWEEMAVPPNLKKGSLANKEFFSYIVEKTLKHGFSFRWSKELEHEEYKAPRSSEWFPVPATHHWEF